MCSGNNSRFVAPSRNRAEAEHEPPRLRLRFRAAGAAAAWLARLSTARLARRRHQLRAPSRGTQHLQRPARGPVDKISKWLASDASLANVQMICSSVSSWCGTPGNCPDDLLFRELIAGLAQRCHKMRKQRPRLLTRGNAFFTLCSVFPGGLRKHVGPPGSAHGACGPGTNKYLPVTYADLRTESNPMFDAQVPMAARVVAHDRGEAAHAAPARPADGCAAGLLPRRVRPRGGGKAQRPVDRAAARRARRPGALPANARGQRQPAAFQRRRAPARALAAAGDARRTPVPARKEARKARRRASDRHRLRRLRRTRRWAWSRPKPQRPTARGQRLCAAGRGRVRHVPDAPDAATRWWQGWCTATTRRSNARSISETAT